MEQRRLRLGDILDDYCPRERRVTNHAVVAMIEEGVKQTRCTTCDAEHVYKGGKAPRRKKSESTGALYKEVLAGLSDQDAVPARAIDTMAIIDDSPADDFNETHDEVVSIVEDTVDEPDEADAGPGDMPAVDEGPVHRPLIRAQLARPEGIKVERQAPDFTIRQNPNGRGGSFRGGAGGGGNGAGGGRSSSASNNNGHRFGRGPQRSGGRGGGTNQGFGRGPASGGGGQQRSGGPRKRSR